MGIVASSCPYRGSTEARRLKEIARIHASADNLSHQTRASPPRAALKHIPALSGTKTLANHRVSTQSLARHQKLTSKCRCWRPEGIKGKTKVDIFLAIDATCEGRETEYVEDGLCRQSKCPPRNHAQPSWTALDRQPTPVRGWASDKKNHWRPHRFSQVCLNICY